MNPDLRKYRDDETAKFRLARRQAARNVLRRRVLPLCVAATLCVTLAAPVWLTLLALITLCEETGHWLRERRASHP